MSMHDQKKRKGWVEKMINVPEVMKFIKIE